MSRTYRRKNSYEEFSCTYDNELITTNGNWYWHRRFLEGKELKKALANFHSDTEQWNWGVPTDFVRSKNRQLRSKNKAILACAIRDFNDDEAVFIPFIRDAMYDYW